MQKKILHGLYLLCMLLTTACYNDYDASEKVARMDILSRFNAEGKAWLCLNINMPEQDGSTRATTFHDGLAAEQTVKTMTIVLFHGSSSTTEDDMEVASSYTVDYSSPIAGPSPQVTNHKTVTIQVTDANIRNSDRLAVLAIANASPSIITGSKFSAVKALTTGITNEIDATTCFVMTNAPLASANDGSGTVTTLANIDPNFFFATEEVAQSNPAGNIYLERAAAKLTVEESISPKTVLGNTNIDFTTGDIKFAISKYNNVGYLVRHFNGDWLAYNNSSNYRFVETAPLESGKYRTYWAEDGNYINGTGLSTINGWKSMGECYYCCENTFNVANMTDENTTAAVVRIRVNGGNDFYTTSVTGSDVIYQPPRNEISEEGTSASSSFSRRHSTKVASAKPIDEYLREWLMETNDDFRIWVNTYAAGEPRHVRIAVETSSTGLTDAKVTAVTQTAHSSGAGATAFNALNLKTYFDNNINIKYYHQGYMFYRVPVRHFDDTQTPWSSTASMTINTTAQAYGSGETAESHYLGRYGMVRNNWYTISIHCVTHVGAPIIPVPTTDADDRVEQLLNATLNISPWTVQNTDL